MNNPLVDVIPVNARRYIYAAYALAGIVVGALAVGGVEIGKADDVLAYLAIPFGALAASNAPDQEPVPAPEPEDDIHG